MRYTFQMSTDYYGREIKRAGWTFLEYVQSNYHGRPRRKQRWLSGYLRAKAKRQAMFEAAEYGDILTPAEMRLVDCDAGLCDCGDPIVDGQFVHRNCILDEPL